MRPILDIPALGREEDAADHFAALVLLGMGKGMALRMLEGAVWGYAHEVRGDAPDESDDADIHGLDRQRSTTSCACPTTAIAHISENW